MGEIQVRDDWRHEVVAVQPQSGPPRYLLSVRKEICRCGTGVRTISLWGAARGAAEEIAWCGHCFSATCERVMGEPVRLPHFESPTGRLDRDGRPYYWEAARPALEDLERRGLL